MDDYIYMLASQPKESDNWREKNNYIDQIYQLAPEPKEDDQWEEKHRFDNLAQFRRLAVIEVIKNRILLAK